MFLSIIGSSLASAGIGLVVSIILTWIVNASFPTEIGGTLADPLGWILTVIIFSIAFVIMHNLPNGSGKRKLLKTYEDKPYDFVSDLKLAATEERNTFIIFAVLSLASQLMSHIGFIYLENPGVLAVIGVILYPFGIAATLFGDYSAVMDGFIWKAVILYVLNLILTCGAYIICLGIFRRRWYKEHIDLVGR